MAEGTGIAEPDRHQEIEDELSILDTNFDPTSQASSGEEGQIATTNTHQSQVGIVHTSLFQTSSSEGGGEIAIPDTVSQVGIANPYIHQATPSAVVVAGGDFKNVNFGPQTSTSHFEARNNVNPTFNYHFHAATNQEASNSASQQRNTRKLQENTELEEGYVRICDDTVIYMREPIREGTLVYQGYQEHVSRDGVPTRLPVVIKKIPDSTDKDKKEVEHLVALGSHPNVVRIIRSIEHETPFGNILFIVMELGGRRNLQDYLKENHKNGTPFDFKKTLKFTKQLVKGMKHIHDNLIVHRDVKPENIILSLDETRVMFADFGLGKKLRQGRTSTKATAQGQGTTGYMAPETLSTEKVSKSSDIFSFGVTMFEIWSNGLNPYGFDIFSRDSNIVNNKPPDFSGLLLTGPLRISFLDLIKPMLQHDPRLRPTIDEVLKHIFLINAKKSEEELLAMSSLNLGERTPSVDENARKQSETTEETEVATTSSNQSERTKSTLQKQAETTDQKQLATTSRNQRKRTESTLRKQADVRPKTRVDALRKLFEDKAFENEGASSVQGEIHYHYRKGVSEGKETAQANILAEGYQKRRFQDNEERGAQLKRREIGEEEAYFQSDDSDPDGESTCDGPESGRAKDASRIKVSREICYFVDKVLARDGTAFEGEQCFFNVGKEKLVKPVAVKLFYHNREDEKWFEKYLKEVKIMIDATSAKTHTNVAQFVSCGRVQKIKQHYIAMHLYHTKTLSIINLDNTTMQQRKAIFIQICYGLKHLHEGLTKPIAHLDLKPGNILFTCDGKNAVVSDFGLSKNAEIKKENGYTLVTESSTSYGGTKGWTAREMMNLSNVGNDEPAKKPIDFLKADIFSLGLLGVKILHKYHPFADKEHKDESSFWHCNIIKNENMDLSSLKVLEKDLFEKMLSKDPSKRPFIEKVLQHCMFWEDAKIVTFVKEVFRCLFENKPPKSKPNLSALFEPLPLQKEQTSTPRTSRPGAASTTKSSESKLLDEVRDAISDCWIYKIIEMKKNELSKLPQEQSKLEKKIQEIQTETPSVEQLQSSFGDDTESQMLHHGNFEALRKRQDKLRKRRENSDKEQEEWDKFKEIVSKDLICYETRREKERKIGQKREEIKQLAQKDTDEKENLEREIRMLSQDLNKLDQQKDSRLKQRKGLKLLGIRQDEFKNSSLQQLLKHLRNCMEHEDYKERIQEILSVFPKLLPFLLRMLSWQEMGEDRKYFEHFLKYPLPGELKLDELN